MAFGLRLARHFFLSFFLIGPRRPPTNGHDLLPGEAVQPGPHAGVQPARLHLGSQREVEVCRPLVRQRLVRPQGAHLAPQRLRRGVLSEPVRRQGRAGSGNKFPSHKQHFVLQQRLLMWPAQTGSPAAAGTCRKQRGTVPAASSTARQASRTVQSQQLWLAGTIIMMVVESNPLH
jgi:hypothetical protein